MYEAISNAKLRSEKKENFQVPKGLPPPRGRPVKNAGKHKKNWYEKGPATKNKRVYLCSVCRLTDYTVKECPLKRLYGGTAE